MRGCLENQAARDKIAVNKTISREIANLILLSLSKLAILTLF